MKVRGPEKAYKVLLTDYTLGMEFGVLVTDLSVSTWLLGKGWSEREEGEAEGKGEREITIPDSSTDPADGASKGTDAPGLHGCTFYSCIFPLPGEKFLTFCPNYLSFS